MKKKYEKLMRKRLHTFSTLDRANHEINPIIIFTYHDVGKNWIWWLTVVFVHCLFFVKSLDYVSISQKLSSFPANSFWLIFNLNILTNVLTTFLTKLIEVLLLQFHRNLLIVILLIDWIDTFSLFTFAVKFHFLLCLQTFLA